MNRAKDDIWDTNKKLMRKSPGVGSHLKEAIKRKELEHRKFCFPPIDVAFCCYAMLSCGAFTVYAKQKNMI